MKVKLILNRNKNVSLAVNVLLSKYNNKVIAILAKFNNLTLTAKAIIRSRSNSV